MFNSYSHASSRVSNNFTINAVSGSILKNHPKSWFTHFNLNSPYAQRVLADGGHEATTKVSYKNGTYGDGFTRWGTREEKDPEHDIIILQMMICGDMEVIAECIYRKDFEEALNPGGDTDVAT